MVPEALYGHHVDRPVGYAPCCYGHGIDPMAPNSAVGATNVIMLLTCGFAASPPLVCGQFVTVTIGIVAINCIMTELHIYRFRQS